jgi:phosphoglycerate-specific signal transduction histidine kinase
MLIMIITSHTHKIIQIYSCLLKLSRKQDTILNIGDFSTKNPTYVHVKNPLRALYKSYLLFTIHFKVCIIELFWLVNFGNIFQSERSLHILSEMIQVFSSGGTCTLLLSFLGVHPNFWGCNVPSNFSFGGTKKKPRKVMHHAVFCKYYGFEQ